MAKKQKVRSIIVRKPTKKIVDAHRIRFGSGFAPAQVARRRLG